MNNQLMKTAIVLSKLEVNLSITEDQIIQLPDDGKQFFIDKIVITNPSVTPVKAMGAQVFDAPEKLGNLLFTSVDSAIQHDFMNTLFVDTNYCQLQIPTDGFPVMNNGHFVKSDKLFFSLQTPHIGCKADLYVFGYILE